MRGAGTRNPLPRRRLSQDDQARLALIMKTHGSREKLVTVLGSTIATLNDAISRGVTEPVAARLEMRLRQLVP